MVSVIAFIALLLITIGVIYAYHIYKNPPREGWTWLSVVVGDFFTDLGMMAIIATVLIFNQLFSQYWYLVTVPPVAHLLTGVPMIIGQVIHKREQDEKIQEITNGKA